MIPEHRAFLDGLVARVGSLGVSGTGTGGSPSTDDLDIVREHLMGARWTSLVKRLTDDVDTKLAGLTDDQRTRLWVLEQAPSLLEPLGLARDEVTHSRLLAWFLDQKDNVGTACRQSLLERLKLGSAVRLDRWHVKRERDLGERGRVDVEIDIPGEALIHIEVKIDAEEREKQLADYRAHIDGCHGYTHRKLVFLTLDGRRGAGGVDHQHLGFATLIADWLPHAVGNDSTAVYLGAWLATLARDVLRAADSGPVEDWNLSRRRSALRFLREGNLDA